MARSRSYKIHRSRAKSRLSEPDNFSNRKRLNQRYGAGEPGIDQYTEEIEVLQSHFASSAYCQRVWRPAEEYTTVAKKAVEAGADAVELNVSCPHVKQTGAEIAQNPKLLADVVDTVKAAVDKPVIVKLSQTLQI